MDVCKVCGHKNPLEEANFCYYCGASFREDGSPEPETAKAAAVTVPSEETDVTQVKRPFSTMQWFGMFMLLLIPLYGWIAFLVIAAISAFGANATEERRSFAKAFLIFLVVAVIAMYLFYLYVQSNPALLAEYNKMMESMYQGSAASGQ
ncbi:MAG: hypothetical protein IJL03_10640 [Lachnospiraceae bacterium]|nr:hypothetical protein [Lachnospiraceae bacterium]